MAWTSIPDKASGDVFTETMWDASIRANQYMGQPTFTTEAARDAEITAPEEGMRAYITAPTIPAGTGTTQLPSGITTIYNGSVWVCVTPVGAYASGNGNTMSTSFTATLGGTPGTNASVTLVTGTTALVSLGALIYSTTAGNSWMSVAVSGAGTVAAATGVTSVYNAGTTGIISGRTFVLSGLTAGTNTFTLQYQAGAYTGNYQDRTIVVQGIA